MYFVVLPDGQKFGPADINLLNQWVAEGRVLPNTMLEEAQTGRRFPASSLPGLQVASVPAPGTFPQPGGLHQPQPYASYYRGGPVAMGDNGQNDLTLAYVFAAIGFAMCLGGGLCGPCSLVGLVFPILGLVYAKKAGDKGNPGANGARIFAGISLGLQIVGLILSIFLLTMGTWT